MNRVTAIFRFVFIFSDERAPIRGPYFLCLRKPCQRSQRRQNKHTVTIRTTTVSAARVRELYGAFNILQ